MKYRSALLHPAIEILSRNLIGIMKYAIAGRQDFHRSIFHRNPRPAQLCAVRSEVPFIEIRYAGVVLHHQRSARRDIIEQFLVICDYIFLRVVGPDP